MLPLIGAIHERRRIVRDGNVFTSGGVTAGIDFAFSIVAEDVARAVQLGIEFDPSPPFDAGHPDKATEAATALMVHRNDNAHSGIKAALENFAIVRSIHSS